LAPLVVAATGRRGFSSSRASVAGRSPRVAVESRDCDRQKAGVRRSLGLAERLRQYCFTQRIHWSHLLRSRLRGLRPRACQRRRWGCSADRPARDARRSEASGSGSCSSRELSRARLVGPVPIQLQSNVLRYLARSNLSILMRAVPTSRSNRLRTSVLSRHCAIDPTRSGSNFLSTAMRFAKDAVGTNGTTAGAIATLPIGKVQQAACLFLCGESLTSTNYLRDARHRGQGEGGLTLGPAK